MVGAVLLTIHEAELVVDGKRDLGKDIADGLWD
jgi:hypothetical protein